AIAALPKNVYLTIDADGFDPAVIPAVGTAEPNGLFWVETLQFLRRVFRERNVVGFDVVECAPIEGSILSEYTLAKLVYRLIGYQVTR
ncbi:MAG TPA: arginase family protein, partial [Bacteroidia bacterium]|nr:arginase family protein [Bacteroidia bacterium]